MKPSSSPASVAAAMWAWTSATSGAVVLASMIALSRPCLPPPTAYTVAGATRAAAAMSSTVVAK